jgi:hypothetical protein
MSNPTERKVGEFEGQSENNSIGEALDAAIGNAKVGLKTDLIDWTLSQISGHHGGFRPERRLNVKITAKQAS